MGNQYEQYLHHEEIVWVRSDLKGKHREHCLCHHCIWFLPGIPETNCEIANLLYAVCLTCNITTPVFECPKFTEKD